MDIFGELKFEDHCNSCYDASIKTIKCMNKKCRKFASFSTLEYDNNNLTNNMAILCRKCEKN